MKIAVRVLWYFAFFWVLVLCAGTFLQYYDFKNESHFLEIKRAAVASGWYLPFFYCHIIASSTILFIGFFQFFKWVINNRPLHKFIGRIYVFGVLCFGAPGAFGMTFFVHRGWGVFTSFMLQNTLWMFTTLAAFIYIRNLKIDEHVQMMRRSYALAFGAVTLRFYIWCCTIFGNGVDFEHNYIIIAFLSWVPNLVLVELINYYDRKNPVYQIENLKK